MHTWSREKYNKTFRLPISIHGFGVRYDIECTKYRYVRWLPPVAHYLGRLIHLYDWADGYAWPRASAGPFHCSLTLAQPGEIYIYKNSQTGRIFQAARTHIRTHIAARSLRQVDMRSYHVVVLALSLFFFTRYGFFRLSHSVLERCWVVSKSPVNIQLGYYFGGSNRPHAPKCRDNGPSWPLTGQSVKKSSFKGCRRSGSGQRTGTFIQSIALNNIDPLPRFPLCRDTPAD